MTGCGRTHCVTLAAPSWRRRCGGRRNAIVPRAAIGALSLALLALGTVIAT